MSFTNDHATGSRIQINVNFNGTSTNTLIIETNLELDASEVGYDKAAIDALRQAGERYMRDNQGTRERPTKIDGIALNGNLKLK